tara:strand:+ start:416 stop:550 length:135 start_codon:yes stop_codon:yes gene_type:complete
MGTHITQEEIEEFEELFEKKSLNFRVIFVMLFLIYLLYLYVAFN